LQRRQGKNADERLHRIVIEVQNCRAAIRTHPVEIRQFVVGKGETLLG
jgi:hypothetical protein